MGGGQLKGKETRASSAWTAEDFLALGASDFADVSAQWRHYGLVPGRCVEIGCGAGRMTAQLARTFASALAVDVSAEQVERARQLLGEAAARVELRVVSGVATPDDAASSDAVFSCHVLQHRPGSEPVRAYLREAFRVLRPAGTLCVRVRVPGAHLTSPQSQLWYTPRNLYKRLRRRQGSRPLAEYHRCPAATLLGTLRELGFADGELRIFAMRSNGDYHSYFFGRRPPAT